MSKHYVVFTVGIAFIPLGKKTNLNRMNEYMSIKIFVTKLCLLKY